MLPPRPRLSNTDRLRLFRLHGQVCHICSQPIDGVRQKWEIEHIISRGMIGAAADTDVMPGSRASAFKRCMDGRTVRRDAEVRP